MTLQHPLTAYRNSQEPRLTIKQLADLIGVAPNTVWRWENGRIPERSEWPKIAQATGIAPDEIVRFTHGNAANNGDSPDSTHTGRISEPDTLPEQSGDSKAEPVP